VSRYAWLGSPASSAEPRTAAACGWASRAGRRTVRLSVCVLITVEGLDGAGKTTLVEGLARELPPPVTVLREPGGVELSERIRDLVKDPALDVDPRAEALLYAAARAQLVAEQLRPRLERGETVLLDRFVDSSLAYQGAGRGLGVDEVRALNAFGTGGVVPDVTLLLRIDPSLRAQRLSGRAEAPDRLELAGEEFFALIARAYDELAAAEPERFVVLDASQPPEAVLRAALQALAA
jgi:dTMP kinase